MGLRCFLFLLVAETLLWRSEATSLRQRRQINNNFPSQPLEPKTYQPPIPLGAPSAPVASSATLHNSYQPPISLIRSNEYQSPLNPPQHPYQPNAPRTYQSPPVPGPQSYVPPNQPQSHSVQYFPPAAPPGNQLQSFSVFQQSAPNSFPQPATSYSVQQQPPQNSNQGQSFAILSDNSGLPQSVAERTYSTHSKVVGSHVPAQAIHKAPASEIQSDKTSSAKEKDNKNDEYVVYYYYYYDNDTAANNNLSLNFDDIPSLEAYDNNEKHGKEPEKSASARTLSANINSLTSASAKSEKDSTPKAETSSSQPRSVGDVYGRPDRPNNHPLEDTLVQPLKPVSNVFRYGSNEVPRFPVLPNFIVTEVPTTAKSEISTPDTLTTEPPTTQSAQINAQPDLRTGDEADDDDLNNVLDSATDLKAIDEKAAEEPTTTTTTTTTEPPTTTEEPTTTTEKSRRRPSLGGGRRRFNPSPAPSFNSNRNRQTQSRSSTSSTTSTTTTSSPTRRSFQGSNRIRPRPSIASNRPRAGSRATEATAEEKSESKAPETTTASTTASSRSRFSSAAPARRFQSSRSRSQVASSTTSTTARTPASASRSRPTSRPRPNLISRNRPPRPGFPRSRPGSEPEEPETTTTPPAPTEEETSPETVNDELPSTNNENNETDEDNETSVEETEEPTTTEGNRFSALFRPRNRNALGNRPRPVIGNRPGRS